MSAKSYTLLNAIRNRIVKYGRKENLKKYYTNHPDCGSLKESLFTRDRSLTLEELIDFMLYPRAKSTEIELLEFSHLIDKHNVNKSDFSQRRKLIPANYLLDLHDDIVSAFYRVGRISLWNGHLLMAGDGSTYSLPNTPGLRDLYLEGRKTGRGQQAIARGVVIKDVLNDIIVGANMECYGRDEIRLLLDLLDNMPRRLMTLSPVMVLDRKFCAYTLLAALMHRKVGFIIRVKEKFNADVDAFIAGTDMERDVALKPASTTMKKLRKLYGNNVPEEFHVRLVRLTHNVIVMTSVKDCSLRETDEDPYHLRWDDETTIGFLKNNLQIEIFSSSRPNSILQDFYAKIIQYNILSALCRQAAELRHDDLPRKINRNVALGIFKFEFSIIMKRRGSDFNKNLKKVLNEISRFSIPVRPNRHNPRVFKKIKHSGKFITLHNYREAL